MLDLHFGIYYMHTTPSPLKFEFLDTLITAGAKIRPVRDLRKFHILNPPPFFQKARVVCVPVSRITVSTIIEFSLLLLFFEVSFLMFSAPFL